MLRPLLILSALILAGCVMAPGYTYYSGDDAGYAPQTTSAGAVAYPEQGADQGGYAGTVDDASGDYYYGEPGPDVVDYAPDYIAYPAYYSALWPVYSSYYDPFFAPNFYYGVTFFPAFYSSFGWGWGWGGGFGFGFGFGGCAYSPWANVYWDNAYDWGWWNRRYSNYYASYRRYGSLHNEQAAIASFAGRARIGAGTWSGQPRATLRATTYTGAGAFRGPARAGQYRTPARVTAGNYRPSERIGALPSARYAAAARSRIAAAGYDRGSRIGPMPAYRGSARLSRGDYAVGHGFDRPTTSAGSWRGAPRVMPGHEAIGPYRSAPSRASMPRDYAAAPRVYDAPRAEAMVPRGGYAPMRGMAMGAPRYSTPAPRYSAPAAHYSAPSGHASSGRGSGNWRSH